MTTSCMDDYGACRFMDDYTPPHPGHSAQHKGTLQLLRTEGTYMWGTSCGSSRRDRPSTGLSGALQNRKRMIG
jgi:hypothetical protein